MAPGKNGKYEYKHLETSNFRIMKLRPGNYKDGLQCELITRGIHQSDSSPELLKYSAISYCWGDQKAAPNSVSCTGADLEVPLNLFDCLRRLRYKNNTRNLWADSICIDQADKEEKPRQVREMRHIYKNAEKVYVWLGDEHEEKAFALIESLKASNSSNFIETVEGCSKDKWESLRRVLKLKWFERVWTLQEIGLATNGVVVCGRSRIGWIDFAEVCGRLHDLCKKTRLDYHLPLYRVTRTNIDFLAGPQGPAGVFKMVRWRDCTEEKDRIYGVLGHVAFKRFQENHNNRHFIEVSPEQDMNALCNSVAKQLLRLPEPLYTLSLVQPKHNPRPPHPSWVPLFNNGSISVLADEKRGPHTWSAGGEAEPVRPPSNDNVLRLKGIKLGSIKWHSETIRNGIKDEDKHDVVKSFWKQIRDHYGSKFSEEKGIWEFCRIIFFEDHFLKRDGLQNSALDIKKQMARCVDYFVKNGIHLSEKKRLQKDFPDGHAEELFPDTIHHCRSRRFIVTETGRLGLATNVSSTGRNGQKADEVWVLTGSQVPFLLRPQKEEGKYLLCGECFIRAMMNGRAMDPTKNGGFEEKTIKIV